MNDVQQAIGSVNGSFMKAFLRADSAAIASLYTTDATLLPPGSPMLRGTSAIQAFWQTAMDTGVKEARLETVNLENNADFVHEIGRYALTIQNSNRQNITVTGKYVVIWKKQNADWRLHIDIWNADS